MRKFPFLALITLVAAPVLASPSNRAEVGQADIPVDRLYPEIAVSDDGWRGLLPVILLDVDEVADQPAKNSERGELNEAALGSATPSSSWRRVPHRAHPG